ncbi:MAG: sugar transferase [Desulfobacterota bacterium]|nr:sugar transferase [Thermodesulfobacteriota bacterium]
MLREHKQYFYPLRLLFDTAALAASFFCCAYLTCMLFPHAIAAPVIDTRMVRLPACGSYFVEFLVLAFLVPLLMLLTSYIKQRSWQETLGERLKISVRISCITGIVMALLSFLSIHAYLHLFFTLLWIPISACLLVGGAALAALCIRRRYRRGDFIYHILICGPDDTALQAAQLFDTHPEWGMHVVGFMTLTSGTDKYTATPYPVLGRDDEFGTIIDRCVVDALLWAGEVHDSTLFQNLAHRCTIRGIDFMHTSSITSEAFAEMFIERLSNRRFLMYKTVYHSPAELFIKRVMDVVISSTLIIAALPLWIFVPLIIRLDSPGPALFRQERVGRHGRRFIMYKFRSMVHNAEQLLPQVQALNEMDGPVFKITDDPRFTRLGKMLRKTSIDELPQLFNVLKGDMSLVGPRPPLFSEVLRYSPWQRKRLAVTPGITCLWQVSGRNKIKFDEWMQLDLQYINNWSLLLDVKILLKTIFAVLSQKGAQ